MTKKVAINRARSVVLASVTSLMLASTAQAGGFEVREQSTHYQGLSFAGSAAGGTLSSMFWNPAAATAAKPGLNFESSYSLILPESEITGSVSNAANPGLAAQLNTLDNSVEIGEDALVGASYAAYRSSIDPNLVFALGLNSQFGLATEPDNDNWVGQLHSQGAAKIFSINVTPTFSYDVLPGVTVGAGLQIQYFELKSFKASGALTGGERTAIQGDDISAGFTAGVILKPVDGTTIGIGYRSWIDHDLVGTFTLTNPGATVVGFGLPTVAGASASVTTPDKITASFEQEISATTRLLGTVEWTNWSRLGTVAVTNTTPFLTRPTGSTPAVVEFEWDDGWFFSLGGEYDYNDKLTLRAGGAYEISPIRNAEQRLVQLPDTDRIWVSAGGSYKWSDAMTFDFAYTHIFSDESDIERFPASTASNALQNTTLFSGESEASVDIISVGLKTHW